MESKGLIIHDQEIYVGTWFLSEGFKVEHRALKKLIVKYKMEFEELGVIASRVQQPNQKKGGRPVQEFMLNEAQATYITTLLTNNSFVRKFKLWLSSEFFRQRKLIARLLSQKQNAEWIAKRDAGKIERRKETDTIKRFVEYAKAQGSQNANKYYVAITKMQNKSLFGLDFLEQKFINIRDMLDGLSLDALMMSDHIIDKAIEEGMEEELPYKKIYTLANDRVKAYAKAIGKSPFQAILKTTHGAHALALDK